MKRSALLLGLVALAACANASDHADVATTTAPTWAWTPTSTGARVSLSRSGEKLLRAPENAGRVTLGFLDAHASDLKIKRPSEELTLKRRETDDLGMTHARFQQTVKGVPVWGAELGAHYDADGRLVELTSHYRENLQDLDVVPTLDAAAAQAIAKQDTLGRATDLTMAELGIEDDKSTLTIYADGQTPKLAHRFTVWSFIDNKTPTRWAYLVDAHTGDILLSYDDLKHEQATGKGVKGDAKTFDVTKQATGFALDSTIEGVRVRTMDSKSTTTIPGTLVTSTTSTFADPAAVDAHFYTLKVVSYYKERHGRNSIDGVGGELISNVHYDLKLNNANWNGKSMQYGDGDGIKQNAFSAAYDVIAHELSHGVTEHSSNLIYKNESGALNEAFSDIIGVMYSHFVKPDPVGNWIIGVGLFIDPVIQYPARYLIDPVSLGDPGHMNQIYRGPDDNGGVHSNSEIIGHAAYLMTEGGIDSTSKTEVKYGIGYEKMEKVFYRANTRYWLENATFKSAAADVLAAAKDLKYTPNEQNILECGFKAVGVLEGACGEITDPSPPPPPTADAGASPTDDSKSKDQSDDDDDKDEETKPSTSKKKTTAPAPAAGGCNSSGSSSGGGWLLALAVAASAVAKRRNRSSLS